MTIIELHSEPVKDEWLDAYGHMNMGFFMVPFGNATWHIMDHFGIGVAYHERTGDAFYTLESHIRYVKEIRAPARIVVEGMILQSDAKRIHYGMVMKVDGIERATCEYLDLHLDMRSGRSAPMPTDVQARLKENQVAIMPSWTGATVSLRKA